MKGVDSRDPGGPAVYRLGCPRRARAGCLLGVDWRSGGVEAGWVMGRAVRDVTRPGPRTAHNIAWRSVHVGL